MKNNGFTLIELLAVIVILAIIALIAVPIVINIIEDAKDESNKRSIELYAEAVKQAIARYQIKNPTVTVRNIATEETGKTYIVDSNGENPLEVEYDGNVTCETIEIYEDGNIYIDNCTVNGDKVEYAYGTSNLSGDSDGAGGITSNKIYANGEVLYFDVAKGVGCTEEEYESSWDGTDYSNSSTGYNGVNNETPIYEAIEMSGFGLAYNVIGYETAPKEQTQNSCLKFYAFNDTEESTTLNLLLDHNTTAHVVWSSEYFSPEDEDNEDMVEFYKKRGPKEVIEQLKTDTESWSGTLEPANYTDEKDGYTINYDGYNARLLLLSDLDNIERVSSSEESFVSKLGWIFDRTSKDCLSNLCLHKADITLNGYWTATSSQYGYPGVWYFYESSFCNNVIAVNNNVLHRGYPGVRPVIEVYKSSL